MKKDLRSHEETDSRYLNREVSWLNFNKRVLFQASCKDNPVLERLRFLAIFESNLDEFFMVRVSGLMEQQEAQLTELSPDGLTATEQIRLILAMAKQLRDEADGIWANSLLPAINKIGVRLLKPNQVPKQKGIELEKYFDKEVFPLCTPLALKPTNSFPFISNRSLNLAVELTGKRGDRKLARVKIPSVLPRVIWFGAKQNDCILIEDLIALHIGKLFPGIKVRGTHRFRVIRDADIEIQELEAADLISNIEQTIRLRRFGAPVLLECDSTMPKRIKSFLLKSLDLEKENSFEVNSVLGMDFCHELASIRRTQHKFQSFAPYISTNIEKSESLFKAISEGEVLVHHPYDSFQSVETFVESAANDKNVVGIKITLYRVGSESPIVESLLQAAEAGKQVAALVELKARFDESNNLVWARALERAGVHVTYGFRDMKTHCKLCLILRQEGSKLKRYAHVATGNYNPETAKQYTDLGLFTANEDVTQDMSELFNLLTGFSQQDRFRKLLFAPLNLREEIIERIRREITSRVSGNRSRIIFKLNSLVDPEVIDALYEASQSGVKIDLIVRGICCLRPGVKGLSENIRVKSIIGRFLEHSRIYYFENGSTPELFIGSADMMRRNLDRRIETLVPVESELQIDYLLNTVLRIYLEDNVKSWELKSNGSYQQVKSKNKGTDAQQELLAHPALKMRFHN